MKAYYYYTPMTYHCYQVGPTDMLAGCHIRQAHSATHGSLLPQATRCIPLQPHMALPFTSATASSWYACRRKVAGFLCVDSTHHLLSLGGVMPCIHVTRHERTQSTDCTS
jgi:hypothetical protein